VLLSKSSYDTFLSANGNVAPELFRCLAPLRVAGKLAPADVDHLASMLQHKVSNGRMYLT
jgi:hypothetical protein